MGEVGEMSLGEIMTKGDNDMCFYKLKTTNWIIIIIMIQKKKKLIDRISN